MSIPLGEVMNRVLPILVLAETKTKCPSLLQVHVYCQTNFSWHWNSVPGALAHTAATNLQFMAKARLHCSEKILLSVLHNVLLHESRAQKEARLSEMMDAVHSGAHSSKGTLDLLCVYWTQWILPCAPGKVTDPPINNKYSHPEDHVNTYHKREDRILPAIFKNAFFVTESFPVQFCKSEKCSRQYRI